MSKNPYILLGISRDASRSDILEALKYKTQIFCSSEDKINNEYYQKLFYDAAEQLLNPETRKIVDENLQTLMENKNYDSKIELPYYYDYFDRSKSEFITYINHEIFDNKLLTRFELMNRYPSHGQFGLEYMYSVVGLDKSFLFAFARDGLLSDVFTRQIIAENEYDEPWKTGDIFKIRGINSLSIPVSKVVPNFLINSQGYILENDLKNLRNSISYAIKENPDVVDGMFKAYKHR